MAEERTPATIEKGASSVWQTPQFTLPEGTYLGQSFFREVYAERLSPNVYRKFYYTNVAGPCTETMFLEQYGGVEYDCNKFDNTILEYAPLREQVKVGGNDATISIPASGSGFIPIDAADVAPDTQYTLPYDGNSLVLPSGDIVDVVSVGTENGGEADGSLYIEVEQREGGSGTLTVESGQELTILFGREISDCDCPEGNFRVQGMPVDTDIKWHSYADARELCGDDLNACSVLQVPLIDSNGNFIEGTAPFTYFNIEQELHADMQKRKNIEVLLELIARVKAAGLKFTPSDSDKIEVEDIRDWKKILDSFGIRNREYLVFAGNVVFSQFMKLRQDAQVTALEITQRPLVDCPWINLDYCGITVEGLTFHIFEACTFSNGYELGGAGSDFPASALLIPAGDRSTRVQWSRGRTGRTGYTDKAFNIVYFRGTNGVTYDVHVDTGGILGPYNPYEPGCIKQKWAVRSNWALETFGLQAWGFIGLGTGS